MERDIFITEVGLSDGLQLVSGVLPISVKLRLADALASTGMGEIEVTSFVPPKIIPQFADAADVMTHVASRRDVSWRVIVPNLKGVQRAIEAGAKSVSYAFSISEAHSLSNVRKTREAQFQDFQSIVEHVRSLPADQRPWLHVGFACVFGCSIQGHVPERDVTHWCERFAEAGIDEIMLCDTVGYANPRQVTRIFRDARAAIGDKLGGAHIHDTRGLGIANVTAALEAGVTRFDSSIGGLGGCPFAPGATGNVATEDVVFLMESMGLKTGIAIDVLLEVRRMFAESVQDCGMAGSLARAGLPAGFRQGLANLERVA
jgi:hydroxymethylglutaryl-CoA lyase